MATTTTKHAEETIASAPSPSTASTIPDGRVLREDRAGDRGGGQEGPRGWLAATTTASTRPLYTPSVSGGAPRTTRANGENHHGVPGAGGVCFFDMDAGFGMAGDFIQGPGWRRRLSGEAAGRATVRKLEGCCDAMTRQTRGL